MVQDTEKAVELRRKGWTYNEIAKELSVAKSSLSLWLRDLPLTDEEKERLKSRRDSNISRGRIKAATSNRANGLDRQKVLASRAEQEFQKRRWDPLFLVGVALYWSEGVKGGACVQFANSNPAMIKAFILWVEKFENTPREALFYRLFIHTPYFHENCENFWSEHLNTPLSRFKKTVCKQSGQIHKKNPSYKGCMRVTVPKSTHLLLKMKVWQNMLASTYV